MVLCSRESERFINAGRHFLSPPRVRRDQSNSPGRAPVLPSVQLSGTSPSRPSACIDVALRASAPGRRPCSRVRPQRHAF